MEVQGSDSKVVGQERNEGEEERRQWADVWQGDQKSLVLPHAFLWDQRFIWFLLYPPL